jgi:hypothetical protein
MAQMRLTQNEMEVLREILRKDLSELTLETAFTHRKDSHDFLRKRKEFMEGFIQRLETEMAFDRGEAGIG